MSLSRRQAQIINQIIQEEVQDVMKGRSRRDELLRRSEIQERLVEAGPDAANVDWSILSKQIEDEVQYTGGGMVQDLIGDFYRKIIKFMASAMNMHSMSFVKVDPRSLEKDLKEYWSENFVEITEECESDITEALEKYAKSLGELAVDMVGRESK